MVFDGPISGILEFSHSLGSDRVRWDNKIELTGNLTRSLPARGTDLIRQLGHYLTRSQRTGCPRSVQTSYLTLGLPAG